MIPTTDNANFICHCDDCSCDLGSFTYKCPVCERRGTDYDIWWEMDAIMGGRSGKFSCQWCDVPLIAFYLRARYESIVMPLLDFQI